MTANKKKRVANVVKTDKKIRNKSKVMDCSTLKDIGESTINESDNESSDSPKYDEERIGF